MCVKHCASLVLFQLRSQNAHRFSYSWQSKSNGPRSRETKGSKKKSARRIFQEIAQELYHKRYVETSHLPEQEGTDENRKALPNPGRA